jgi:retron-type reverse transcriptase
MRILKYDIEKVTGIPWKKKKSYRYLYRLACREDVIKKAFKRMRKGKTKRKDFQMAEENLDAWVKKIQEIILNTKPDGWQTDPQKRFKPVKHNPVIIKEFGKTRVVYVPTMVELWIQHVIVMILEPIIAGSSYPMSFSSFPGRGSLKGQRAIRRWIESGKGIRNFAQADIRHFYSHIQYNPVIIKEFGKTRVVYVPTMVELWIQHVIVMILEPIIAGSSYPMSFSSFPGRGSLKGQRAIRRWIESGKGIRNFAKFLIPFPLSIQRLIARCPFREPLPGNDEKLIG